LATVWWGLAGLAFHALSRHVPGQTRREAQLMTFFDFVVPVVAQMRPV
jgi:hypothetical protein